VAPQSTQLAPLIRSRGINHLAHLRQRATSWLVLHAWTLQCVACRSGATSSSTEGPPTRAHYRQGPGGHAAESARPLAPPPASQSVRVHTILVVEPVQVVSSRGMRFRNSEVSERHRGGPGYPPGLSGSPSLRCQTPLAAVYDRDSSVRGCLSYAEGPEPGCGRWLPTSRRHLRDATTAAAESRAGYRTARGMRPCVADRRNGDQVRGSLYRNAG
jgi:hypothetical protein